MIDTNKKWRGLTLTTRDISISEKLSLKPHSLFFNSKYTCHKKIIGHRSIVVLNVLRTLVYCQGIILKTNHRINVKLNLLIWSNKPAKKKIKNTSSRKKVSKLYLGLWLMPHRKWDRTFWSWRLFWALPWTGWRRSSRQESLWRSWTLRGGAPRSPDTSPRQAGCTGTQPWGTSPAHLKILEFTLNFIRNEVRIIMIYTLYLH